MAQLLLLAVVLFATRLLFAPMLFHVRCYMLVVGCMYVLHMNLHSTDHSHINCTIVLCTASTVMQILPVPLKMNNAGQDLYDYWS